MLADTVQLLKYVGFDLIFVETAGIGQSDTEIVDLVDLSIYVMTSEYGAASQLEKIDMLDYAQLVALNKFEKRGALDAFLSARAWTVHVVVLDGLWEAARLPSFVRTLTRVRCRVATADVFDYDGRARVSHDEVVERMRAAMCAKLSEMRRHPAAAAAATHSSDARARGESGLLTR